MWLALKTGTLPSGWAGEDPAAIETAIRMILQEEAKSSG